MQLGLMAGLTTFSQKQLCYWRYDGQDWHGPIVIEKEVKFDGTWGFFRPRLAVANTGDVHVVWNTQTDPSHVVASGPTASFSIQDAIPDCEVIATDFCAEMLEHASSRGVAETLVADALDLPFPDGGFDVVTVAFGLRNMADYEKGLGEMCRVLKSGGHLFILDFSLPQGAMRGPYRLYLHHVLPKLAGFLTREKDAYEYLGGSIEQFPSGEAMISLLAKTGFKQAVSTPMTFGVVSVYEAVRKA